MKSFPVTHSIPSAAHFVDVMKANYRLGPRLDCRLFRSGIADTYDLRAGKKRFMLRICRVAWTTPAGIAYEVEALLHLLAKRAPVAAPIARRDGGFITYISAPEGRRPAVLFAYARGREHVRDVVTSKSYGDALARIHNAGESFASRSSRAPIDVDFLVRKSLLRLAPLAMEHPKSWRYIAQIARKLDGRLSETGRNLSSGLCHGDSHGGNASYENGRTVFFDLEFCGPGWHAYDLATVAWNFSFPGETMRQEKWRAFLAGYRTHRKIAAEDLAAIPLLVVAREIWLLGLHIGYRDLWGHSWFDDRYIARRLGIVREWEKFEYPAALRGEKR